MLEELIRDTRFEANSRWCRAKEKLLFWAVWKLPRRVVEIAAVRVWANATSGPFGHEDATGVRMDVAVKRWMKREGGDKTFHPSEVSY